MTIGLNERRLKIVKYIVLMCVVLLVLETASQSDQLTIIELKHLPADDVIPVLRPFLAPGETLTGAKYTLFLNSTPETTARIRSIVATLDKAPRELIITVVQGENARENLSSVDVSGNITVGNNVDIVFGRNPQESGSISVTGRSKESLKREHNIQRVRVQEGLPATLFIGQTIPVYPLQYGRRDRRHVGYQHITTGFRILTRLADDRFVLDIASRGGSSTSNIHKGVGHQQIQTQVQGRLGEWLDIGGVFGGVGRSETGIVYNDSGNKEKAWQVFLTVVEIK